MNRHANWTPDEVTALRRHWNYNWSGVIATANSTGRSQFAVWSKASALGYRIKYSWGHWTPEDEEALKTLWNEAKKTANEIAGIMGKSRNSIIGKARRMGLSARTSPIKIKPGNRAGRPKKDAAARRRAAIVGDNVHFLDLGKGQCRFPMWGNDEAPSHIYCGCDTEGHSNYCPDHKRLVIRKTISAEDLAKREEARVNSHKRQKFVFG